MMNDQTAQNQMNQQSATQPQRSYVDDYFPPHTPPITGSNTIVGSSAPSTFPQDTSAVGDTNKSDATLEPMSDEFSWLDDLDTSMSAPQANGQPDQYTIPDPYAQVTPLDNQDKYSDAQATGWGTVDEQIDEDWANSESPSQPSAPTPNSAPPNPLPPNPAPRATKDLLEDMQSTSEALEDQNVFDLLGVKDGTDEQKEAFLDELQQVIWEDFLENDTKLLLTEQEMAELDKLLGDGSEKKIELQEEVVVYLEKLIPDLEDIMLEKALELKSDLFKERLSGVKEYAIDDQQKLATVAEVEKLVSENKWRSAARLLDSV